MAMNPTIKWLLIIVIIFIVLILVIFAVQYFSRPAVPNNGANPPVNNIDNITKNILATLFSSDWIKNLFGKGNMVAPACQASNPGFDNNGYYTKACGGVPGGGGANCDPDNPGKDMNGFSSSQCGGGGRMAAPATMTNINMIPADRLSQMNDSEKNITRQLYDNVNQLGLNATNIASNMQTINAFIQNANNQFKNIGSTMTISFISNNTANARVNCTGIECFEINVILFRYCHCRPAAK